MPHASTAFFVLLGLLTSHFFLTLAVKFNCLPCCRDPDSDDSDIEMQEQQQPNIIPANPVYRPCNNRQGRIGGPDWENWAPEGGWACDGSKVDFPTVECLVADMKSCGNIGVNTVFYSFGAGTPDARRFRDTLEPKGTMFNDALDDSYISKVIRPSSNFGLAGPMVAGTSGLNKDLNRNDIFTFRYCEAMATASSGTAYLVVSNYNGDPVANEGGRPGIFQNPLTRTPPNLWIPYELPTLQRNVSFLHSFKRPSWAKDLIRHGSEIPLLLLREASSLALAIND